MIINIKYCRTKGVLYSLCAVLNLNQPLCLLCKLNPALIALDGLYNGRASSSRHCACFVLPRANRFHNSISKCSKWWCNNCSLINGRRYKTAQIVRVGENGSKGDVTFIKCDKFRICLCSWRAAVPPPERKPNLIWVTVQPGGGFKPESKWHYCLLHDVIVTYWSTVQVWRCPGLMA